MIGLVSGCTRFDALNALSPGNGYTATLDESYASSPRQKLDVYRPTHANSPAPVVIFFYGGGWEAGSKHDYRFVARSLVGQGYVVVLPDYRLYPDVTFPAFVQDGAAAIKWTHENIARFGGDPKRIYLMGHSAGAHTAVLLALDGHSLADVSVPSSAIKAVAALAGPYCFQPLRDPTLCSIFGPAAQSTCIEPATFASANTPPILLETGAKDELVPPEHSARLAAQLESAGAPAKLVTYPHLGHEGIALSLSPAFTFLSPALKDAISFFQQHQ